ncbi:hypothetical protein ACIGNX_31895 [Actinosynnema sp. NPDC053489]|uniref:hypothetical protein n=1 Tax=Actinosynnema sp. NPDC053489 TaxID=3363916 RepID=UPI0037CA1F25
MTSQRRRARARRPRPDPVRVEELVAYLRADRGWRDEVAKRLVARLDQRLVRSARSYGCRPIAHVAEELDSQACVDLGPGVPYQLAKAVYGQVGLRGAARLRQTARSLRVLGVYLCGSDLAGCPCTEALARDPQQVRVDRVVSGALDGAGF